MKSVNVFFFDHHLALIVPFFAHFTAAANVCDSKDHSPVKQTQTR